MYDIIIIGGGPAGISAALYAVSRGKSTLVLEKERIGGLAGTVSLVSHYASVADGETGPEFAAKLRDQAQRSGVEVVYKDVRSVELVGDVKTVRTDDETYEATRVIIANGCTPRKLGVPGERELAGKGTGLNALRDGERYRGKNVYVIGGADGAVKEALHLSQFARALTLVCIEEKLACAAEFQKKLAEKNNVTVVPASRLHALEGSEQVEKVYLENIGTGLITEIEDPGAGVFIYAGSTPNTELYPELTLVDGYIPVNERMETEILGVYAAGDIRVTPVRQIATAVSDGAVAAIHAAR